MTNQNDTHRPSRARAHSAVECTSEPYLQSSPKQHHQGPAYPNRGARATRFRCLKKVKPTRRNRIEPGRACVRLQLETTAARAPETVGHACLTPALGRSAGYNQTCKNPALQGRVLVARTRGPYSVAMRTQPLFVLACHANASRR
jgi:hypothetical protein